MPERILPSVARTATVAAAAVILLGGAALGGWTEVRAGEATVYAGDACLEVFEAPSFAAPSIDCLPDGTIIVTLDGTEAAEGETWQQVETGGRTGWVQASALSTRPGDALTDTSTATSSTFAFPVPPEGGLTIGVATTSDLAELIGAQAFEVASVSMFDVSDQQFLVHVVGAPQLVNTLGPASVEPGAVVLMRRSGENGGAHVAGAVAPPRNAETVGISGIPFLAPPAGGLTAGQAWAEDIESVVAAQAFEVETISAWDVPGQRWLTYVVGAPASVNSLTDAHLAPDRPLFIKRATPPPEPPDGPRTEERITYYFCERGSNPATWGDGGGFCGHMRNGEVVHSGAAACASSLLGTRFRIEGDPTERIYTCTDTGSAVHSGHRDIWFANSDEGAAWWRQVGTRAIVVTLP